MLSESQPVVTCKAYSAREVWLNLELVINLLSVVESSRIYSSYYDQNMNKTDTIHTGASLYILLKEI